MEISSAQYEALVSQLHSRIQAVSVRVKQVRPAAKKGADHWYVTEGLATAALSLADKIVEICEEILNKLKELMRGAYAPMTLFHHSREWQSDVRGKASTVQGNTTADALKAPLVWHGDAATAYKVAVADQTKAAEQIKNSADKIATSLGWCALAGFGLYVALAGVLYEVIVSLGAAITALGSLVFSWAGALYAVTQITASAATVFLAVGAASTLIATQKQQIATIEGEATESGALQEGKWPRGTSPF